MRIGPGRTSPRPRRSFSTPAARLESPRASSTPLPATCSGVTLTMKVRLRHQGDRCYRRTADIGRVTGHSYVVYGPLANGATGVTYEGAPNHPAPHHSAISSTGMASLIFYTAPTAIRAFMRWGDDHVKRSSAVAPLLGTVGEPINPRRGCGIIALRTETLPDRGHLVADRDRRDHGHAASRDHPDETGLGHTAILLVSC